MSEVDPSIPQRLEHALRRNVVPAVVMASAIGSLLGVTAKTIYDRNAEESARERLRTISVPWQEVEGFTQTKTDVIRFAGDPEQAGKSRLDCGRIGILALPAAQVRKQITDRGLQVGIARWATDNPDTAYIGLVGAADQLSTQTRQVHPGETPDPQSAETGRIDLAAVGLRVCDGDLSVGLVGIARDGTPYGVHGTERLGSYTAEEITSEYSHSGLLSVPVA